MFNSDILFNGYYGQKNTGDDAFVEVTAWAAQTIWNKKDIRYLAKNEKLPNTLYPKRAFPLELPKTFRLQQYLLIKNTKVFISAGGSTFHAELEKNNLKHLALKRKLIKGNNFKLGAIGISIGPFKSDRAERSIINYLKNLDFLTLRDKRSYEYARELDLPYNPVESFDMAALMPDIYDSYKKINKKKTIGVSLCNSERFTGGDIEKEKNRNKKLTALIQALDNNSEVHFKFFIINGHPIYGDKELTLQTIGEAKLNNNFEIVDYNKNTQEIWQDIANCDFMLSTRLHGAIFACFANTPFILIEYHQKCNDFLQDVGFDRNLRVYDMEEDVGKAANKILEIIDNQANYCVPTFTEEMKKKALLNFTSINL